MRPTGVGGERLQPFCGNLKRPGDAPTGAVFDGTIALYARAVVTLSEYDLAPALPVGSPDFSS